MSITRHLVHQNVLRGVERKSKVREQEVLVVRAAKGSREASLTK